MSKDYQTFTDEVKDDKKIEHKPEEGLLIDRLMENSGYTYYQWKLIIICNFLLFADGIHMNITNNLFIPLKNLYNLDDATYAFISSILFVGVALGSIVSGFISNSLGRKSSIVYANLIMFFFSFGMALANNYIMFTICRFTIGICLGTIIPMLFGILTEYLPIYNRGFVLVVVWNGFSIGVIYTLCMMLLFTPNYETTGVRAVLISCSIPFLVITIMLYLWLDESPRWMILEGQELEGLKLLEKMTKTTLTDEEKEQIKREIKGGINQEMKVSITYLFHHNYFKISIILIFIWAINSYLLYGGMFVLQQTLNKIQKSTNVNKPSDVIIDQIIIQIIGLPGNFISPIFAEIKVLGRIYSTVLCYVLGSIFTALAVISRNHFSIYYGFSNLFIGSAFNISSAYTSEVYPTVIRDTALGFFYFCTRVSGFSSQYLSTGLENIMFLLNYYTMIVISVVGAIVSLCLN